MKSTAKLHIEAASVAQRIRAMDSITLQRRIVGLLQTAETEHELAAEDEGDFYRGRSMAFFHALEMLSGLDLERPT